MPAVLGDAARLWCANHTVEVFVAATDLGVPQPYVKGDAMLSWLADSLNYGRNSQQAEHHPDVQDQWLSENEAGYVRVCTAAFESR